MPPFTSRLAPVVAGVALCLPLAAQAPPPPSAVDYSTFFLAEVRDSPECELTLGDDGRFDFGPRVTNPAMTCPDAAAWAAFVEAVAERFWEDWSTNEQLWPHAPWPRCRSGDAAACCAELERTNDPDPAHCPAFPGPTPGVPAHRPHQPTKAHQVDRTEAAAAGDDGDGLGDWADVPAVLKTSVIGAEQVELIYRNEPLAEYVFANELYFTEGLARVFGTAERALASAPFHPRRYDPVDAPATPPPIDSVDLPIASIMVKVDWLDVDLAPRLGIDPDGAHPFLVMDLVDSRSGTTKRFLMLSFHVSTKDIPNWLWATFEHVDNQGRCDWIGCNDSFGYLVPEPPVAPMPAHQIAPAARNYVPPRQLDNVDGAGVRAFALAERYPAETISAELTALFRSAGIGVGPPSSGGSPTVADPAWRSYRLKGSQTEFVTAQGRPTRLGNSVTEAGFTNSSSCISCHSRAAVGADGAMVYSIFADELSDAGLPKSVHGIPNERWFHVNAYRGVGGQREAPRLISVQTDFVWGFRNACPHDRSGLSEGDRCFGPTTVPVRP